MTEILSGTEGTEGTEGTGTEITEGTEDGGYRGNRVHRRNGETETSRAARWVGKSATSLAPVVAVSAMKSRASFKYPAISGGGVAMARWMTVDPSEFNDITRRIL